MDREYLKMVLALPDDFFKDIKPAFGNLYWVETYQGWKEGYSRKTNATCSIILDTGTYYLSLQDRQNMDEVVGSWEFEYNRRDNAIHWKKWIIPSQEQLQDCLLSYFKCTPELLYLKFVAWVQVQERYHPDFKIISFNCAWLQYYIYEINRSTWNSEAWI